MTKGSLSDKRWSWGSILIERGECGGGGAGGPSMHTCAELPRPEEADHHWMSRDAVLDSSGRSHHRFPKNALQLEDGSPIELSLAGQRSKAPGTISVTDGGPYGANKWFGKVTSAGTWEPAGSQGGTVKNNSVVLYRRGRCPRVA